MLREMTFFSSARDCIFLSPALLLAERQRDDKGAGEGRMVQSDGAKSQIANDSRSRHFNAEF